MVPLPLYLAFGALLFVIGVVGVLTSQCHHCPHVHRTDAQRRQSDVDQFLALFKDLRGQIFTLFIIAVAASEAAVGLALVISLYREPRSISTK